MAERQPERTLTVYYESAKAIMTKHELCEDAITGLHGVQAERKGPIVSTARQAIGQAKQAHKRLDIAAKRGLGAVEPGFFDRTAWVQDLDEEE
jgi:hypothetical protein